MDISYNKKASFYYNNLIKLYLLSEKSSYFSKIWEKKWQEGLVKFSGQSILTKIHGYDVIANYGFTYPYFMRRFKTLNNPIVELAYQTNLVKKKTITIIDIGASIGDTILLLQSNCQDMINEFYCIDGDEEFFKYLENNLSQFKNGTFIKALLSDKVEKSKELVRIHSGTASAQGEVSTQSQTLDTVLQISNLKQLDMLKIDVDGYDGKILKGATQLLKKFNPSVIFEWHPILCRNTGNNGSDHFEALINSGYNRFIWYTKFGTFSHFMTGYDRESIKLLEEICFNNKYNYDWHYDIIALHETSLISPIKLAEAEFSKTKKSRW